MKSAVGRIGANHPGGSDQVPDQHAPSGQAVLIELQPPLDLTVYLLQGWQPAVCSASIIFANCCSEMSRPFNS